MQAAASCASSGVAMATDAEVALVSHLLARSASADGEETFLGMLHGSVLERGMAEGGAVEVEGHVNASTRTAMRLKDATMGVGLDAASVDVLCMVLDLDCDKARTRTNIIQPHMAQKPVRRGEVGCACVAREVSVERGGVGERGCARRLGGWVWV